ncbi:hypothetical protein FACS1894187_11510 [Synergistales bacterium]|nr:hypothetical protein FACS1894187_11510 [Synergistales bacterium]
MVGFNIAMGANYHSGMEKGREEGREEALKDIVRSMLARSMSLESISDILGMPVDEIEALRKQE